MVPLIVPIMYPAPANKWHIYRALQGINLATWTSMAAHSMHCLCVALMMICSIFLFTQFL